MKLRTLALALWLIPLAQGATTINIATNVAVRDVHRFGLDLAQINYYDSGQLMKELVFRNPGFEGQLFQSVERVGSGTTTNAVEDGPWTQWPTGFWTGAAYEFIWGTAKGRTGTVATSVNPRDPGAITNGTSYIFSDSGTAPAAGDYLVLRKTETGDAAGGSATTGWWLNLSGGATATSELLDLPPGTVGRQCIRLCATNAGQSLTLSGNFDTWNGVSFVQLNGSFRLIFKAKGVGGANRLLVTLRRGAGNYWINTTVQLTNVWQTYTNTFAAAENGTALGGVSLQFMPVSQSAALLDEVSLRQTDGDPTNTSEFRDAAVNAIRALKPGFLRSSNWQQLGDSLDNALAPPFARLRSGYSNYSTNSGSILLGLHEFLGLCELVGADPWFSSPMTYTPQEFGNLMEYFGGSTNTPYGARRAALGHPAPWTGVFNRIHVEFGNEAWNGGYRGGNMGDTTAYGNRGSELFGVAKSSPYYDSAKFNFILGEQWVNPWRVIHTHNASANHDTITIAGYMASQIDSYADNEQLFGSVFAEPEWWSKPNGLMYQDYTNLLHSSRPVPLSIYEVNINVPGGAIAGSQAALTAYTPSLGAGLAVADHMLMALRELQCREQGLFALPGYEFQTGTNWAFVWSVVRDMGVTDRKRPVFLACQLANRALAGDCVQTAHTGDDPTWTVNNVNHITYTNAHYLQSYAFANGTNRSAIVFNLHRTTALDINFGGALAPTGNVAVSVLTSAAITDNNENSNVVAVASQTLTNFNAAAGLTLPAYSMSLLEWQEPPPAPPATPPVAAFSAAPTNGTAPLMVTFTDVSTGTIINRFWDFGDGTTTNLDAITTNVAHTFASAGTHLVQLLVGGPGGASTNNCSVLVQAAIPVYTLIYGTGPHGAISGSATQGVNRGESGSAVTAVADPGYQFTLWSDGNAANPRTDANVQSNLNTMAAFAPVGTITGGANTNVGGSVIGSGTFFVGSNAVLTATASNGWRFISWSDGSTNNPRNIVVASNTTYTALFAPTALLVVQANPVNGGTASGGGLQLIGSNATVMAAASNGWVFVNWNGAVTNNPWTFSVVSNGLVCTAYFARPATVSVAASPACAGSVSGGGSYPLGSTATLFAAAAPGWTFSRWNDGNTNASRDVSVAAPGNAYTAFFVMGLGMALNASNLTWITGGSAPWSVQATTTRDGSAAQSGALGAGQTSFFQTTTNGPASLLFWWKVSSAATNQLQFFIGTQLVNHISGNVGWNQVITFIGHTNPVTLTWTYAKNSAAVSGSDAGFVDQITWLPCPYAEHVPQLFFQESGGMLASWVISSTGSFQFARILANTGSWALKSAGDINGDGVSDLLFQSASGDTAGWFLNADGSVRDARYWFNIGSWEIKAAGDYENLGRAQVFFQTARGDAAYWRLDTNGAFLASVGLGNMGPWKLRGAGDLDGDHKAELFWQNAAGVVAIWYHNPDGSIRGALAFSTGEWALSGVTDVDLDGVCDLIWQTPDTRTGGWFMQTNGTARSASFWWPTGGWKLKAAGR